MVEKSDIAWKIYQGALIPDKPPHQVFYISDEEANQLLGKSGAYLIRWTSNFDCDHETTFWYIIKDSTCSLEELSRNTRSKVRRGLKNCVVKRVNSTYIATHAYNIYLQAFDRYTSGVLPISKEAFVKNINTLDSAEWDFWAVFNKAGDLIAYSQNRLQDASCDYKVIKFDPSALKLYSSYALFYEMNRYYLDDLQYKYVNDGARSIYHDTNIQNFLIDKFKFRKAYCKLHVIYRPDISIIVKLLFPLRSIISKAPLAAFKKVSALLKLEKMRRNNGQY